ncbi:REPEAT-CONTAINING PROTEIN putative-RELATED [Salix koriyanagi]|uniref:REPEAT-CONTAINING PROTEIN putative-RELATED n=1 Tax=Salix koriyanagi TaxID=2511006 RepID=A0A9Q1AMC8_9ROSI|nr:REPEAT-CONTAINING PROTEIN putative-RELATED [Salix koriyanagi]
MCNTHLQKILLSLKSKTHNIKFLDQILTQTITTGFTYSIPTWNCLIRAYSRSPTTPTKAILVYKYFIKTCSTRPDNYTYPCLLKACSRLFTDSNGKQVHTHVIKTGLDSDIFVQNALVHLYGTVGNSTDACFLFDRMPNRDVASWNSLMGIYNANNSFNEVMVLFKKLMCGCVKADRISLVIVLSASAQAQMEDLEYGRLVHGHVIKVGFGCFLEVNNALLNFYIKCKEIDEASKMFDEFVHEGDVVSYTILINAYVEMGMIDLARDVFDEIVDKDRVLWNLMCARLVHRFINRNSNAEEFIRLLLPEERLIAYKTLLSACIKYSEFDFGKKVANEMSKLSSNSHETHILLSNFYALAGQWAQVAETRESMDGFNTRKEPGMSFVDVKP